MPEQQDRRGTRPLDDEPLTLDPAARTRSRARDGVARAAQTGAARRGPALPVQETVGVRVSRAWARHPVVAFATHSRRVAFYRQLLALVKSGSGMPVALTEMARYAPDGRTRRALAEVAREIEHGSGLGEAMSRHAGLFNDSFVELLMFGEKTGSMEPVLGRILDHMQQQQQLRWTAITASLWPAYLFAGFILFGPLFDIAAAAGSKTNTASYGAIYAVGLLRNLFVGGAALGGLLLSPLALAAARLEAAWDRLKLALPIVGPVIRAGYASRFFMALGLALAAGVEAAGALRISLRASGSPAIAARTGVAESRIRAGGTLADAVETVGVFTQPQLGTLAIGERTGTLDSTLAELAQDTQETAVRGMKIVVLAALFFVAIIAVVVVLRPILHTIFGPISDYFKTIDSLSE